MTHIEDRAGASPRMSASLVLLHIPKTGGRTLRLILEPMYEAGARIRLYGPGRQGGFELVPPDQRAAIRFVVGHIQFGIHHHLAAPANYITLLREPVARVLSLYRFILRTPDHPLHEELVARRVSLEEFVSACPGFRDNDQTRLIGNWSGPDATPPEALERAKQHLVEHFAVAGITERFDESLLLMNRHFHWPRTFYLPVNVAPDRPGSFSVGREAAELIQQRNRLDRELYDFASQRLSAAARRAGPAFRLEARLFGLANRAYNYARSRYGRLRATAGRPRRQPD